MEDRAEFPKLYTNSTLSSTFPVVFRCTKFQFCSSDESVATHCLYIAHGILHSHICHTSIEALPALGCVDGIEMGETTK